MKLVHGMRWILAQLLRAGQAIQNAVVTKKKVYDDHNETRRGTNFRKLIDNDMDLFIF